MVVVVTGIIIIVLAWSVPVPGLTGDSPPWSGTMSALSAGHGLTSVYDSVRFLITMAHGCKNIQTRNAYFAPFKAKFSSKSP